MLIWSLTMNIKLAALFLIYTCTATSSDSDLQKSFTEGVQFTARWALPAVAVTACTYFGIIRPLASRADNFSGKFDDFNGEVRRAVDVVDAVKNEVAELRRQLGEETIPELNGVFKKIAQTATEVDSTLVSTRNTMKKVGDSVERVGNSAHQSLGLLDKEVVASRGMLAKSLKGFDSLLIVAHQTTGMVGVAATNVSVVLESTKKTVEDFADTAQDVKKNLLPQCNITAAQAASAAIQIGSAAEQAKSSYLFRAVTLGGINSPRG